MGRAVFSSWSICMQSSGRVSASDSVGVRLHLSRSLLISLSTKCLAIATIVFTQIRMGFLRDVDLDPKMPTTRSSHSCRACNSIRASRFHHSFPRSKSSLSLWKADGAGARRVCRCKSAITSRGRNFPNRAMPALLLVKKNILLSFKLSSLYVHVNEVLSCSSS